jgi:hypothetical protein
MGRRVAEATNASRMRRTRGEIVRVRFRAAVVFAAGDLAGLADFFPAVFDGNFAGPADF